MKNRPALSYFILTILLFANASAFSISFGEMSYKPVVINNKIENMWLKYENTSEYDAAGRIIHLLTRAGNEEWFEYNNDGKMTFHKETWDTEETDVKKDIEYKCYEYNDEGKLIYDKEVKEYEKSDKSSVKEEHWYTPDGKLLKYKYTRDEEKKHNDFSEYVELYEYDEKGLLIRELKDRWKENVTEYTYNENGNLLFKIVRDEKGEIQKAIQNSYDRNGNITTSVTKKPGEYKKKNGKWVQELEVVETIKWKYKYDKNNRLIYKEEPGEYNKDLIFKTVYKYDAKGNLIFENQDNTSIYYTYNSENILIKKRTETIFEDEKSNPYIDEEQYDLNGNRIYYYTNHLVSLFKNDKEYEEFYEYNEHNQLIHFKAPKKVVDFYIDSKLEKTLPSPTAEYWIDYWPNGKKKEERYANSSLNLYNENEEPLYIKKVHNEYNWQNNIQTFTDENFYGYDDQNNILYCVGPDTKNEYYEYEYSSDGSKKTRKQYSIYFTMPSLYECKCIEAYEYDLYGNLTYQMKVKDSYVEEKRTEYTYEFDTNGRMVKLISSDSNSNTNSEIYEYDDYGNINHKIYNDGNYEEWFEYDSKGHLLSWHNNDNSSETYEYNEKGLKISHTKKWTERFYEEYDNIVNRIVDFEFNEWYEYDKSENLIYYKNSDGREERYNSKGKTIWEKDIDGKEYTYEYDSDGNILSYKTSDGRTITYEYKKVEDLVYCTKNGKSTYSYVKDSQGNQIYYCSEEGKVTHRIYDLQGNEICYHYNPNKWNVKSTEHWTFYEYHPNGKLKSKMIYEEIK